MFLLSQRATNVSAWCQASISSWSLSPVYLLAPSLICAAQVHQFLQTTPADYYAVVFLLQISGDLQILPGGFYTTKHGSTTIHRALHMALQLYKGLYNTTRGSTLLYKGLYNTTRGSKLLYSTGLYITQQGYTGLSITTQGSTPLYRPEHGKNWGQSSRCHLHKPLGTEMAEVTNLTYFRWSLLIPYS